MGGRGICFRTFGFLCVCFNEKSRKRAPLRFSVTFVNGMVETAYQAWVASGQGILGKSCAMTSPQSGVLRCAAGPGGEVLATQFKRILPLQPAGLGRNGDSETSVGLDSKG